MEDATTIEIEPVAFPESSRPIDEPNLARPAKPERNPAPKRRSAKRRAARSSSAVKGTREKGRIAFTYHDLQTAIGIARAMLNAGGGAITRDQLAGITSLSATGGTFLMRTAAARLFGLITYNQSRFGLTPLAFEILGNDEQMRRSAKAAAFLSVPLFAAIYSEFKGKQLPPRPHGLEAAFVRLGVPDKQRKTARLAFDKSAKQAGFFDNGGDRLVEPIIGGGATLASTGTMKADATIINSEVPPSLTGRTRGSAKINSNYHPFIQGLLETLPEAGDDWPEEGRRKWLQAAVDIFGLIYDGEANITVSAVRKTSESAP
jgi:hypothetical protein